MDPTGATAPGCTGCVYMFTENEMYLDAVSPITKFPLLPPTKSVSMLTRFDLI